MLTEFDCKKMFDNIIFLAKEKSLRIGELETASGVSIGYISRTKESGAKPGIDFVVKAAQTLGVSVDMLLKADLTKSTPTDRYLITFLEKLKSGTNERKYNWICEPKAELDALGKNDEEITHRMFIRARVKVAGDNGRIKNVTKAVFFSRAYAENTEIAGNCFHLPLDQTSGLYLMNVTNGAKAVFGSPITELWVYKGGDSTYVCDNFSNACIAILVDELYRMVLEISNTAQVDPKLKDFIDSIIGDVPSV